MCKDDLQCVNVNGYVQVTWLCSSSPSHQLIIPFAQSAVHCTSELHNAMESIGKHAYLATSAHTVINQKINRSDNN